MIVCSPVIYSYSSFLMILFLQFSPHPVLVSLWGIEQWTGLGVAPSVQQMTLGRPTLKPHLSNLAANYQIYHFLFGGFLRRRRSEAEEKIFCELTSEQTKGQAGSHNKRFLLWHFVNTGKWRKLFGNIICWWFENVEEKYIFKFGSSSKTPPLPLILLSNSETNFSLQWNWKGFFDQYDFQSIT